MKIKNNITITMLILALGLASCEKVLEVEPVDYIEEGQITTRNDAYRLLYGCYDALQQTGMYGRHMVIIPGLVADNLEWEGTTLEYGQFANNSILSDNAMVESIWNAHYDMINRVNFLIYKLPDIDDLSQDERTDINAQLYFLRALGHFNLVRLFGPVPVKTKPTLDLSSDLNPARIPTESVYQQITDDLLAAEGNIVNSSPVYASNGAVDALLSMVYLQTGNYDLAVQHATNVVNLYSYSLEPEYANLFTQAIVPEAVFLVAFNTTDGNRLADYFLPNSMSGRYEVGPSDSLIAAFSVDDSLRHKASIAGDAPPYCAKYPNIATFENNVYVIRLAEIYLIRAEAEAMRNGVIGDIQYDINQVRHRAGLGDTDADTHDELLLAIEKERRNELAFEGKRWFDLLRTGRAMELVGSVTNTDQLLFPIPLSELQANTNPGMYQNQGY